VKQMLFRKFLSSVAFCIILEAELYLSVVVMCSNKGRQYQNDGPKAHKKYEQIVSGPALVSTHCILGALSLGVKRLGRETDHSPSSSAKVKNACGYTSTPPYVFITYGA